MAVGTMLFFEISPLSSRVVVPSCAAKGLPPPGHHGARFSGCLNGLPGALEKEMLICWSWEIFHEKIRFTKDSR